ncbi:MAG: response regulator transcription factor [Bacteroidota bacterium]
MKYTVVIVDDHTLVARALAKMVNQFEGFNVLYEVGNGRELIEKLEKQENLPDIVLLDINMPIMDGFETATWLKGNHPEVHILALSVQEEERILVKIIRCGAGGYLLKNVRPSDLEHALESIVRRGYYYPDWVAHTMITNIANNKGGIPINDRELEFLNYAATELTYKEIADRMCCSPRTVEGYRDNLFEKFELKTRVSLVVYAIKNKLISI